MELLNIKKVVVKDWDLNLISELNLSYNPEGIAFKPYKHALYIHPYKVQGKCHWHDWFIDLKIIESFEVQADCLCIYLKTANACYAWDDELDEDVLTNEWYQVVALLDGEQHTFKYKNRKNALEKMDALLYREGLNVYDMSVQGIQHVKIGKKGIKTENDVEFI